MFPAIGIAMAIVCSVTGDYFVKRGAAQITTPPLQAYGGAKGLLNPLQLFQFLAKSHIFHWKLILGIFILTFFFIGYLIAIKSASVTLVVPLMSITNVIDTLVGKFLLRERVNWLRWVGILVIIGGVIMLVTPGNGTG
ncbi:MAG: EamA family transporter [Syntrophobacteraceae bacterium]